MHDKQTVTIGFRIPSLLLNILQDEIFVTMSLIIDDKHITIVSQRIHVRHQCIRRQFLRFYPSAEPTLIASIIAWHIAVTIVAAIVHQRPGEHSIIHVFFVNIFTGIIEVRKTQTVGKLMA